MLRICDSTLSITCLPRFLPNTTQRSRTSCLIGLGRFGSFPTGNCDTSSSNSKSRRRSSSRGREEQTHHYNHIYFSRNTHHLKYTFSFFSERSFQGHFFASLGVDCTLPDHVFSRQVIASTRRRQRPRREATADRGAEAPEPYFLGYVCIPQTKDPPLQI